VTGLIVGQLHFPQGGIYADPSNPIAIWRATFTVTDFAPRTIALETDTRQFAVYQRRADPPHPPPFHEAMIDIRVIPAPGALLVMSGAMGLSIRRRRRKAMVKGVV
jgi:hypothetical protein